MSNHLDPDQDRTSVGPDMGPNCLERLSADDKSCSKQIKSLSGSSPYLFFFYFEGTQIFFKSLKFRERSGPVVECLTRDRGAAGSSLTRVTALCP